VVDEKPGLDGAAEADVVVRLAPLEFPEIAVGEPVLRQLELLAVLDLLMEQAMNVADSVAIGRDLERRHRFHEAGGAPAEAAIAARRVGLELDDRVEVDAEVGE